jgi:hypothetical protein
MTIWTPRELADLAAADEIAIVPRRLDGHLGQPRTIWIVAVDHDLYVRSYRGPAGSWFRTASRTGAAVVRTPRGDVDVELIDASDVDRAAVDVAYRAKYGRSSYVTAMTNDEAAATTMRITPIRPTDET